MKHNLQLLLTVAVLFLVAIRWSVAQESTAELSQAAANPLADLMSFPFQNNTDFNLGEFNRTRNVLNIQPVIPLAGGKLITRTIIPFVWLPDITAESGSFSILLFGSLAMAGTLTVRRLSRSTGKGRVCDKF